MVEKQPLKGETLAAKPLGPSHPCPSSDWCLLTGPSHGSVENKGEYLECSFACQFPECFSNFSPRHSDAFVSLLPGNKQRGRAQSGSAQCPGTSLAESLPKGWKPGCHSSLAPQIPSAALQSWEVCSLYWGLKQAGTWPWECSRPGSQALCKCLWWGPNDLYSPHSNHLSL